MDAPRAVGRTQPRGGQTLTKVVKKFFVSARNRNLTLFVKFFGKKLNLCYNFGPIGPKFQKFWPNLTNMANFEPSLASNFGNFFLNIRVPPVTIFSTAGQGGQEPPPAPPPYGPALFLYLNIFRLCNYQLDLGSLRMTIPRVCYLKR